MVKVYYNEFDERAAAWLVELMRAGEIPDGEVDTRSILDVHPEDLKGYDQCHFFAGIGGWALALRLAGWGDRPIWTGSCPCQPFSAAGAGAGGADERHLWPAWFWLIERCRPPVLVGEQVEAAIKFGWIDLVHDDLEGIGYTVAPIGLPAACVGAFHIRQRLWFVAESNRARHPRDRQEPLQRARHREGPESGADGCGADDRMADDLGAGRGQFETARLHERRQAESSHEPAAGDVDRTLRHDTDGRGGSGGLADTDRRRTRELPGELRGDEGQHDQRSEAGDRVASGDGQDGRLADTGRERRGREDEQGPDREDPTERQQETDDHQRRGSDGDVAGPQGQPEPRAAGPRDEGTAPERAGTSFWHNVIWIPCRDGKARPIEPSIQPLAYGVSGRVGLLRGAGNAIVPQVGQEVVEAYMDIIGLERAVR